MKNETEKKFKYGLKFKFRHLVSDSECLYLSESDTMKSIELYLIYKSSGHWEINNTIVKLESISDAFNIRMYFDDYFYELIRYS